MKIISALWLVLITCLVALSSWGQGMLVSFDLSQVTNGATSYQFTHGASGLTFDLSTSDRWENGGDPTAQVGFKTFSDAQKGFFGMGVLEETNGFTMTFRFNKRVRLESYTISSVQTPFDGDEFVRLSDGTNTTQEGNRAAGDYSFANRFEIAANTDLTLTSINPTYPIDPDVDQHIIWRYLRVTVIPEPGTYALFLGSVVLALAIKRRKLWG